MINYLVKNRDFGDCIMTEEIKFQKDSSMESLKFLKNVMKYKEQFQFFRCEVYLLEEKLRKMNIFIDLEKESTIFNMIGKISEENDLTLLKSPQNLDQIDEKTAYWIIQRIFENDLVFNEILESFREAKSFAQFFISSLKAENPEERVHFFTNGKAVDGPPFYTIQKKEILGYTTATENITDTGIIAFSKTRVGIIWASGDD